MCCINLDTRVILANFFGSPYFDEIPGESVDLEKIRQCAVFLSNNLPGYVNYDLSRKELENAASTGQFALVEDGTCISKQQDIDREKVNKVYPQYIAEKLKKLSDDYLMKHLYEKTIVPIKMLFY